MAPERSGSSESQNGEKKSTKPSRKISRFLVSPVVDRGENLEGKTIQETEKGEVKENGLDHEFVPTHQYSSQVQAHQTVVDVKPEEMKPEQPLNNVINTNLLNAAALPSLTTPLQIATDTPLLGKLE